MLFDRKLPQTLANAMCSCVCSSVSFSCNFVTFQPLFYCFSLSLSPPTPQKKKEEKKEEILIELPRCAYGCCFLKFYVRVFLISKNELGQ